QLDGTGNTQIVQSATDGSHNASKGDLLHATFMQQSRAVPENRGQSAASRVNKTARKKNQGPKMQTTLETAIQDGNVMLTETPAKKSGATRQPATLTGWAQHAEYHAADQVLHLTGSPRITDGEAMQMAAESIDYHRDTQNAAASGNVKATYTQQQKNSPGSAPAVGFAGGGSSPVHVIAERAALVHATNQNLFYGARNELGAVQTPARMWQDADSLLAPVIEIDRNQNLLKAWGEGTGTAPVVNANFTSAMGANHQQSVVRVHSQTLVYSDKDRQGDFHGAVSAEQSDEIIHADDALLFLKPAPVAGATKQASQQPPQAGGAGQLDHMIATGHVVFTQPGRKGNGEKLVYTASDGTYVLTGTEAAPPQIWDRVHGTTTGAALSFNSQDDSIVVSGGKSSAVTETRAKK
ncbi:MAG: LptA/OstA family protein, partial [Acidobacteriaceae bacterium]